MHGRARVSNGYRYTKTKGDRAIKSSIKIFYSLCTLSILVGLAEAQNSSPAKSKPVLLANYYVWYHSGEHKSDPYGGWTHPNQKKSGPVSQRGIALDEPEVASTLYPLVGLYDSQDVQIAEWHVRLAQAAGIDGFLVSWWGNLSQHDQTLEKGILAAAKKFDFKIALLDERAQYHDDFEWYKTNLSESLRRFKNHSAYLTIDNKPVVYLYQVASNPSLTPVKFRELKDFIEDAHGPIYWIVNKLAHNHQGQGDSIKHIPSDWLATPGIDCFAFYSTFSHFRAHEYLNIAGKYRYVTAQAQDAGKHMMLPVHPGHDNSRFSDSPYIIPREEGETFKGYLRAAEESEADIVMVTSWNEWPESTVIEPSDSWSNPYLYLEILAEWKGIEFIPPEVPVRD